MSKAELLTLEDINNALNHQISEGSAYQWACYGSNARYLDYTISGTDVTASVIYDTVSQEVYEACLCNAYSDQAFRWTNPSYRRAYRREAVNNGVDPDQAWDDISYTEVARGGWLQLAIEWMDSYWSDSIEEDHLEINDEYESSTLVQINLDPDELLQLCMMAHDRDITLNSLVNNILREYIDEHGTN